MVNRISDINFLKRPEIIDEKDPIYPAYAERNQIEGFVKTIITVKRDGTVEIFKIVESCPDTLFNQAVSNVITTLKVMPSDKADTADFRRFKRTWNFKEDHAARRRLSFGSQGWNNRAMQFVINP